MFLRKPQSARPRNTVTNTCVAQMRSRVHALAQATKHTYTQCVSRTPTFKATNSYKILGLIHE